MPFRIQPDAVVAELAAAQHGRMSRRQLLDRGVTDGEIRARVRSGHLERRHRGVLALAGTPESARASAVAALLWLGDEAGISRRSAARFLGMPLRGDGRLHVTVPRTGRRANAADRGLIVHRSLCWDPLRDLTLVDGIRVTTPQRTALDLRHELTPREVERVLDHFEFHLLDAAPLLSARVFRDALDAHVPGSTMTVSELEEIGLREARARRLDRPVCNAWVRGATGHTYRGDLVFHAARLIIEVDGPHHGRPRQGRKDAARDADLRADGWRIDRVAP